MNDRNCSGCGTASSIGEAGAKAYANYTEKAAPKVDPLENAFKLIESEKEHRSLQADQILMLRMVMPSFAAQVRQLQQGLFSWFQHQGFWPSGWDAKFAGFRAVYSEQDREQNNLKRMEKLGLIVTEVAECMEAVRKSDRDNEAEELADVLVRVLDYAGGFNIPLAEAFERKMLANYARPMKHGKEF
jgi:NTP pyrophosphatase (non-canonical NTP hydrolase)